jgi:pimeloyl-ACP methyl ester carboxylesterase
LPNSESARPSKHSAVVVALDFLFYEGTDVHSNLLLITFLLPAWALGADLPRQPDAVDEAYPGIALQYGELAVEDGVRLRTILTRPDGVARPPVILFVQWLSCSSVEVRPDREDGWSRMLRGVIRDSGWAVMRTDQRGVGVSEGGPCGKLDYDTELADHRMALAALATRDDIDPHRIVVFGASMGARMAGQLAAGAPGVVGVLGWGGGSKTWFERMLAFSRNGMERSGDDAADIARRMRSHATLYSSYLLEGKDPPEIIAADPDMTDTWSDIIGTSPTDHYGRPFAFHQQAQKADWTAAWGRVDVPVLVTMGEYDWFENAAGHETVVRIVNRREAGLARFVTIPQMDHHFTMYNSAGDAFHDEGGRANPGPFLRVALPWLGDL